MIRSGPGFCLQSHYVIILAISRQCPVVANVQMPLTVNTANAHHHERELLHTRCLCTPTMAYARTVSETSQNLRWSEQVSRRSKSRLHQILFSAAKLLVG